MAPFGPFGPLSIPTCSLRTGFPDGISLQQSPCRNICFPVYNFFYHYFGCDAVHHFQCESPEVPSPRLLAGSSLGQGPTSPQLSPVCLVISLLSLLGTPCSYATVSMIICGTLCWGTFLEAMIIFKNALVETETDLLRWLYKLLFLLNGLAQKGHKTFSPRCWVLLWLSRSHLDGKVIAQN